MSLLTLAEQLVREGFEIRIVCPGEGSMLAACTKAGLPTLVVSFQQPDWKRIDLTLRATIQWCRLLRKNKVDLIHANDLLTARSVALAAWVRGIPVVCHVRFGQLRFETLKWAFRHLPHPKAFIFNSRFLQKEVGPILHGVCRKSIQVVVHNAVDTKRFTANNRPFDRLRVGILANLIPFKGHEDFLHMAADLTRRHVDAEYWIVGEDVHKTGYEQTLKRVMEELGISDRVRFLGYRSDVSDVLNELDIVVCSSHYEPFGRCVIEAMACAKPVVATNVGGIPEIIKDKANGILVPPKAPDKLADAVADLTDNSTLRVMLGKLARRHVEQHFGSETHARHILDLYDSVCSPTRR